MSQMPSSSFGKPTAPLFFSALPRAARIKLLAAVFFIFAPIMILTCSTLAARSWKTMGIWCVISGLIAVLWAGSRLLSRKLLWAAVTLTLMGSASLAFRWPPGFVPEVARPSFIGIAAALLVVGGYVLFVMFIGSEGVRTLRLQTELRLAQQIHQSLVPPIALSTEAIDVFGRSDASSEMGGDLIDIVIEHAGAEGTSTPGHVDLYLADVSGHGVRAGVLMAMVKSALRTRLLAGTTDIGEVIGDLNRVVAQVKQDDMFVTLASMRIESSLPADGAPSEESRHCTVHCSLAGHLPILHWHSRERVLRPIDNQSLPLGVVADERFDPSPVNCASGDLLVLYTDGLVECTNPAGEEFGLERFQKLLADHAELPLDAVFDRMIKTVRAHGPQIDDQSLLLVRIR